MRGVATADESGEGAWVSELCQKNDQYRSAEKRPYYVKVPLTNAAGDVTCDKDSFRRCAGERVGLQRTSAMSLWECAVMMDV